MKPRVTGRVASFLSMIHHPSGSFPFTPGPSEPRRIVDRSDLVAAESARVELEVEQTVASRALEVESGASSVWGSHVREGVSGLSVQVELEGACTNGKTSFQGMSASLAWHILQSQIVARAFRCDVSQLTGNAC